MKNLAEQRKKEILNSIFPSGNGLSLEEKLDMLKNVLQIFPRKLEGLFEKREAIEQENVINNLEL